MNKLIVGVKKLYNEAKLPLYAHPGDSGADLYAYLPFQYETIEPGKWVMIPTGIALNLPDGYEAQIRSRSGLAAKKGLFCLNSPGTIDSQYTGEIQVILANFSDEPVCVGHFDKIAQMVISPVQQAKFEAVSELRETQRGAGGIGSTGIK